MENNLNDYRPIDARLLEYFYDDVKKNNIFKGKVVENIGISTKGNYPLFLVTFTDKTYIAITADEDDSGDPNLYVKYLPRNEYYTDAFYSNNFHFLESGNMVCPTWVEMLIDFGLWKLDSEQIKKVQDRYKKLGKKRDYQKFLELKERFDKGEFNDID